MVPAISIVPDEPDPITTGLLQEVSVLEESQSSNKVIVILYSVAGPVPAFTFGKNNEFSQSVALNVAAGLIVAGKENDFKNAFDKATKHLNSGNVFQHLEKIQSAL